MAFAVGHNIDVSRGKEFSLDVGRGITRRAISGPFDSSRIPVVAPVVFCGRVRRKQANTPKRRDLNGPFSEGGKLMFRDVKPRTLTLKSRLIASASMVGTAALVAGILAFRQPAAADAHCDSVNGPVVAAARKSLDTGEVKYILAYVQPDAEAELTAAFKETLGVRQNPQAQALADRYFFETAVRLHRAGEGAAYTGLKTQSDYGPALDAAEAALDSGSTADVKVLLNNAMLTGLDAKYKAVVDARGRASVEDTVDAYREQAEAELIFEKYVDALYTAALPQTLHTEGAVAVEQAPAAHAH